MRQIIFESGFRQKYYMENMFKRGHFIEIDEDTFDDLVIRYRNCFNMQYEFCENCDKRIFTEKETGIRYIIERR